MAQEASKDQLYSTLARLYVACRFGTDVHREKMLVETEKVLSVTEDAQVLVHRVWSGMDIEAQQ